MKNLKRMMLIAVASVALLGCGGGGGGDSGPEVVKKKGVLVFVHGGGWTMAPPVLPAPSTIGLEELAAEAGFEYRTITYPLATPDWHSFPHAHHAVMNQLLELRGEFDKVYALGSSAGANLVALAGLERPDSMDKAALYYGVYDLPAMDDEFNGLYSNLFAADLYQASPTHIGQLTMPHQLWHGSADALVPPEQSTAYSPATILVEGAPHGFHLMDWTGPQLKAFLFP